MDNIVNLYSLANQADSVQSSSSSSSSTTTPRNGITQPATELEPPPSALPTTTTTTTSTRPTSPTTSSMRIDSPEIERPIYPSNINSDTSSSGTGTGTGTTNLNRVITTTIETINGSTNSAAKPKRQRRSYSCGPCKLLKIKCDLQIPCTACKKFKRINRCLLQPPQPPSEQELNKIKERKKRSNIKKMRLSNDFVQTYNTSPNCIPSLASSIDATSVNLEKLNRLNTSSSKSLPHQDNPTTASSSSSSSVTHTAGAHTGTAHSPSSSSGATSPGQKITHSMIQIRPHQTRFQPEASKNEKYHSINFLTTPTLEGENQTTVNFTDNIQAGDIIESLTILDSKRYIDLTMVDVKRIKRLLPSDFSIFETLAEFYLHTIDPILIELQDYPKIINQSRSTYHKLLAIDDDNPKNLSLNVSFNLIELRDLSLFFLILANGLLFDLRENSNPSNFLLEKTLYKTKKVVLEDWIKISKFIKLKILMYENLTDIIYLMDWYLMVKNYYDFNNMMVENYLEFNNLLNYLILNNDFISTIEDPSNATCTSPTPEGVVEDGPYPESREFKILAKYWIQLRLVEIEFTFFQFKGSLLLSNQLKNTVSPYKRLLDILYKHNKFDSISQNTIEIWGLYYRRSKNTTSIRCIIKDYLQLYAYIFATMKNELDFLEANLPADDSPVTLAEVELLIKNQRCLLLFIKWLSFIRIESNYFPSLRYTSYLTSIMNVFNHFNYLNKRSKGTVLTMVLENYPLIYIKFFYQCIAFQGLFLILLKNTIACHKNFKVDLVKIYHIMVEQFQEVLSVFLTNEYNVSLGKNVTSFAVCINLVVDLNKYINDPTDPIDDLTDLIYDFKPRISDQSWDFLIDYFFGSRDNFARYIEKIWDLFEYLKIDDTEMDKSDFAKYRSIPITQNISLNDELIDSTLGKFHGFEFDIDIVNDYVKHCVEPNIQD